MTHSHYSRISWDKEVNASYPEETLAVASVASGSSGHHFGAAGALSIAWSEFGCNLSYHILHNS